MACISLLVACTKSDLPDFNTSGLSGNDSKGHSVIQEGVFIVFPNGVDDTEALKDAFDDAFDYGPNAVVKLVEGEYYIDLIEIRNFCGSLEGAGAGKTIIAPIVNLSIDDVNSQNLYPVLLKFVGGNVHLSEMTLTTPPGSLSTGSRDWLEGLVGFFGFSQQYETANRYINVTVNKVEIVGHPENVGYGLMTGSDSQWMDEGIPLSNIDISITNSFFSNCGWYGACVMMIKEGSIIAGSRNNGNTFENNPSVGLGIWHNTSVKIEVQSNSFTSRDAYCGLEIYSAPYPGFLQQIPQTFASVCNIEQNDFDISGCMSAMIINDNRRRFFPEESPMLVQIKNNSLKTDETNTSGIRCNNLSGAVIRNNKFTGGGSNGVFILRQANVYNENGLMLGNNFSNTMYLEATVIFNIGTRNWTIVGGNLGETVWDYGENNIITGYNNNTSERPLGPTIIDNLEEMREAVHGLKDQ